MAQWPGEPSLDLGRLDAQASIERHDTGRISKERVDVELADLRVIGGELAEADQDFDDSIDIRRWLAAIILQEPPHSGARHQPARKRCVERRQLEGTVTYDLDSRASLAEQDQWTEYRVFNQPNEEFQGTRTADHRLNQKFVKAGFGTSRLDPFEHRRPLLAEPDRRRLD